MRTSQWDIFFVVVTVFGGLLGALVAALTFARVWRARNQPYSNVAAVGVFLISALFMITAVLLVWWFTGFTGMPWPIWAEAASLRPFLMPLFTRETFGAW